MSSGGRLTPTIAKPSSDSTRSISMTRLAFMVLAEANQGCSAVSGAACIGDRDADEGLKYAVLDDGRPALE